MKQAIMFASTFPASDASSATLDDANALRYSADTQQLYRMVQELRALVLHERAEAADLRSRVYQHRLAAAAVETTDDRWRSARDIYDDAEAALHDADCSLAAVRGAPETDAERAYRAARAELERAFFEFRQAHRELSVLVAIYLRASAR
ncbi:MAG TPA: hypothetical protein VIV11_38105 [Kofleriaceae bacterium]